MGGGEGRTLGGVPGALEDEVRLVHDALGSKERWSKRMTSEVGAIVAGAVVRITPYGAFVRLETGETGLVHISEIDRNYVRSVEDHLHLDDVVRIKVVGIKEDGKIDLSIKQADPDWQPQARPRRASKDPEFEQKLKRFMRNSEERLVDVKRQREARRG